MYLAARSWELAPSEIARLTLQQWFLEHEAKRERDPERDYAGSLTQADIDELREMD